MTDSRTETVTFLFTDVEGSTRLLRRLGDLNGEVLGEHERLLRHAFALHGGREIDTQGDSFFVAFASASDAVLAAVDAQRAFGSHDWPLRVRMRLHAGRATVRDNRYLGVAVHRAARIAAAGHGGQILLSEDDAEPARRRGGGSAGSRSARPRRAAAQSRASMRSGWQAGRVTP